MSDQQLIGVIGGNSPHSSSLLLQYFNDLQSGMDVQQHQPLLIYNNPRIPLFHSHWSQDTHDPMSEYHRTAMSLVSAGATAICCASNTAHMYTDQLAPTLPVPFISMVTLAANEAVALCMAKGGKFIGILGATTVIHSGLYHKAIEDATVARNGVGIGVLTPDDPGQKAITELINSGMRSGFDHHDQTNVVFAHQTRQLAIRGAAVIILACTEIPLVFTEQTNTLLVNPLRLLAVHSLQYANNDINAMNHPAVSMPTSNTVPMAPSRAPTADGSAANELRSYIQDRTSGKRKLVNLWDGKTTNGTEDGNLMRLKKIRLDRMTALGEHHQVAGKAERWCVLCSEYTIGESNNKIRKGSKTMFKCSVCDVALCRGKKTVKGKKNDDAPPSCFDHFHSDETLGSAESYRNATANNDSTIPMNDDAIVSVSAAAAITN